MPITFAIQVVGLSDAIAKLGPANLGPPLRRMFERAGIAGSSAAKRHAPVDTGRYRSSIAYEIDSATPPVWTTIGSNVEYAPYLEFGTRPHFPPVAALAVWAQRHHVPAFLVARAISRRGGKAHAPLQKGLQDLLFGQLDDYARQAEQEIVQALGG